MIELPIFGKPKMTAEDLANEFLEENRGEIDLAFFSAVSGVPFAMPLAKFKGWADSKGYNRDVEELAVALQTKLDSKLKETMSKQG